MSSVALYFDFSCPWSYLALVRMQDVCERNRAGLELIPVSVRRILETENPDKATERFSSNPAKASWQRKDIQDWAMMWGLTIDYRDDWPQNSDMAATAAQAAIDAGAGLPFCLTAFRALYSDCADLNDSDVLGAIATEVGLNAKLVMEAIGNADRLTQIHRQSLELIERGGFGTPSLFVNDTLFFGNDRVPIVEWMLGPMADDDFVLPGQHG